MADELVGTDADRLFSESFVAHLSQISLGHNDPRGGDRGPVEDHEIWPGILENEPHRTRINDVDLANACVEFPGARAFVPFEAELYVISGNGVAVMKRKPLTQFEFVREAVRALRPRLCQAVAHLLPRQRTHQRIVERIQNPKWRDLRRGRRRVEPTRGNSDGPGHHRLSR